MGTFGTLTVRMPYLFTMLVVLFSKDLVDVEGSFVPGGVVVCCVVCGSCWGGSSAPREAFEDDREAM